MTTFKTAARGKGLARKIPPALKAKFDEAAAAGKAGNFAQAAEIYAGVAKKAGEKGKNGVAARSGLRAVKAYMKAKDLKNAAGAMNFAIKHAAQAKNRDKMLGRIRQLHTKLTSKGRDKAAAMLAKQVQEHFGVSL